VSQDALTQLLAQLQAAQSDEEREWLVMQLSLANMAAPLRQAVWAAAIPHWFDAGFLAALLDEEDEQAYELYQALQVPSFVEPFPGRGYNLHERSRALLLQKLWGEERERYRELSRRAAAYCARQDQADTGWRVETVYHLLVADPDRGADQLQSTGWEWHDPPNFAYDKVETLARLAREHGDAGRLGARGLGWTRFWEALLDYYYSRFPAARLKFLQIETDPQTDPAMAAVVAFRLGNVHRMLAEYADARARYEQALSLYLEIGDRRGAANCIRALGDVYLRLPEYADARARYEQALPLFREIGDRRGAANCILRLGEVHLKLDENADARARYEQALPLFREIGDRLGEANCIAGLADLDRQDERWAAAGEKYRQALACYREIGAAFTEALALQRLGHTAKGAGDPAQARAHYRAALDIFTRIASPVAEEVQANLDALDAT